MITWGTSPQDVVTIDGKVPNPKNEKDPDKKNSIERSLKYMGLKPDTFIKDIKIDKKTLFKSWKKDKIIEQAVQLNLSGFKESLQLQSEDVKYSSQSFEQRLFALFEAEINQRQDKRIKRFLNAAKLKDKLASLDQIQYLPKRKIDKSVVSSLASCDFITNSQNILITGATGTGYVK